MMETRLEALFKYGKNVVTGGGDQAVVSACPGVSTCYQSRLQGLTPLLRYRPFKNNGTKKEGKNPLPKLSAPEKYDDNSTASII